MQEQFSRTEMILGKEAMEKLAASRVAVFGIGGVGGYVCEALIRSGVGSFDLIDNDKVSLSNLNRQIIATHKTIGRLKTEVMRERMLEINPGADIRVWNMFLLPGNASEIPFDEYSYVVDAVDTVTAKIELALKCREFGIPIISCMGTGNKLDGSLLKVADIYETKVCPLARDLRKELRKRGIESLKVVYSEERSISPVKDMSAGCLTDSPDPRETEYNNSGRRSIPGSVSFVPSAAGLLIAGEVVRDLVHGSLLSGLDEPFTPLLKQK